MSADSSARVPIARWNPARGVWETPTSSMFCGHAVPFSETWPKSGSMRTGCLYPLTKPELTISASESSSSDGLLPTPWASQHNYGESLESWEARNKRLRETWSNEKHPHGNGNGMGTPLAIAVQQLLKTPTAQLAVNGGSQHPDKRRAGGHGPTLADQVEHEVESSRPLPGGIARSAAEGSLLPTPAARDFKSGKSNMMDRNARPLSEVIETGLLLPTPDASMGTGGRVSANMGKTRPSGSKKSIQLSDVVHHHLSPGDHTSQPSAAGSEAMGQLSLDLGD